MFSFLILVNSYSLECNLEIKVIIMTERMMSLQFRMCRKLHANHSYPHHACDGK